MIPKFSVSDFLAVINQTLETAYSAVEVEGEVASLKVSQGKFVFFDLKDASGTVGCFMTVWQMRVPIEDGMKIIVRASPKVTQWGKFSLTVQSYRPSGEGSLKKSFELLRAKLDGEGLFDVERKRSLPIWPSRVAVVSSTESAGYADFVKILNDRWGGLQVDVAHVQVQGEVAADQIIKAISYFNQRPELPEVLVIVRGGGSADDLSVFNDEPLVRAIAASRIPTLVGVGHEVDETLADMVADVRAATPSNAAQILVPDRREVIASTRAQVMRLSDRVLEVVDVLERQVADKMMSALSFVERGLDNRLDKLEHLRNMLGAHNPQSVLERGYAIVRGKLSVGSLITVETKDKRLEAEVKNVKTR